MDSQSLLHQSIPIAITFQIVITLPSDFSYLFPDSHHYHTLAITSLVFNYQFQDSHRLAITSPSVFSYQFPDSHTLEITSPEVFSYQSLIDNR